MKSEIEEFARLLVRIVRDRSIVSCDGQTKLESNSPIALRWRRFHIDANSTALAEAMISDCVDDAIFHLLQAIDCGDLQLRFVASTGTIVDLTKDGMGELAGWYMMGKEGWRAQFTQQRFSDDLDRLE